MEVGQLSQLIGQSLPGSSVSQRQPSIVMPAMTKPRYVTGSQTEGDLTKKLAVMKPANHLRLSQLRGESRSPSPSANGSNRQTTPPASPQVPRIRLTRHDDVSVTGSQTLLKESPGLGILPINNDSSAMTRGQPSSPSSSRSSSPCLNFYPRPDVINDDALSMTSSVMSLFDTASMDSEGEDGGGKGGGAESPRIGRARRGWDWLWSGRRRRQGSEMRRCVSLTDAVTEEGEGAGGEDDAAGGCDVSGGRGLRKQARVSDSVLTVREAGPGGGRGSGLLSLGSAFLDVDVDLQRQRRRRLEGGRVNPTFSGSCLSLPSLGFEPSTTPTTTLLTRTTPADPAEGAESQPDQGPLFSARLYNRIGRKVDGSDALTNLSHVSHVYKGVVLLTDFLEGRITVMGHNGRPVKDYVTEPKAEPWCACVTRRGHVAVTLRRQSLVTVWSGSGHLVREFGHGVLVRPTGLACHTASGNFVVTDEATNRAAVFSETGKFLHYLGQYPHSPDAADDRNDSTASKADTAARNDTASRKKEAAAHNDNTACKKDTADHTDATDRMKDTAAQNVSAARCKSNCGSTQQSGTRSSSNSGVKGEREGQSRTVTRQPPERGQENRRVIVDPEGRKDSEGCSGRVARPNQHDDGSQGGTVGSPRQGRGRVSFNPVARCRSFTNTDLTQPLQGSELASGFDNNLPDSEKSPACSRRFEGNNKSLPDNENSPICSRRFQENNNILPNNENSPECSRRFQENNNIHPNNENSPICSRRFQGKDNKVESDDVSLDSYNSVPEPDTITTADSVKTTNSDRSTQPLDDNDNIRKPFQFSNPRYVCVTNSGKIVVSDSGSNSVKVFSAAGDFIRSIAGRSRHGRGDLKIPYGVCSDHFENIYVADYYNDRVSVFSIDGQFLQNILTSSSGLIRPKSVAVRSSAHERKLYVAHGDLRTTEVLVFTVLPNCKHSVSFKFDV